MKTKRNIELSPGVLSDSFDLLEMCTSSSTGISLRDLRDAYGTKICVADQETVLGFAQECRWVAVDSAGALRLTSHGERIVSFEENDRSVEQIHDFIMAVKPPWSRLLKTGRNARHYMPANACQTFDELNLFGSDDYAVQAWDRLACAVEGFGSQLGKEETGRIGEKLTVDFEETRTGRKPEWVALETDKAGFDVLSWEGVSGSRMSIEVKATKRALADAMFHVTRNEWDTAATTQHYKFYLWALPRNGSKANLCIIDAKYLKPNAPRDQGKGRWESVKVPFSVAWKSKYAELVEVERL